MAIIANPVYDTVFNFLMEDNRVAKILLSALLQKEVVELHVRQHEYAKKVKREISVLRIDFSAKVRDKDGKENLVLIELQKTWLETETLRFRQYLGAHYLDERNAPPRKENPKGYGLPIVTIYLLDHRVGDLEEPMVYVRRRYLDYDSNALSRGVPDPFVESLTHDAIIVQIPLLKGRPRNHLERLLEVFDQSRRLEENAHFLQIDETRPRSREEQLVIDRLVKAAASQELLTDMRIEDEFLSVLENRDTELMVSKTELKKSKEENKKKDQIIEQKNQQIEQKDKELSEKNLLLVSMLCEQGRSNEEIAILLHLTEEEVDKLLGTEK